MTLCNMVDDQNLDVAQTEVRSKFLPSGRAALQIQTDPCISEEKDNRDLAFRLRSTALNLPYPSVVEKINANKRTNHSDIETSKSSTNELQLTLVTDSNELADSHEDTLSEISPRSRRTDAPCNAETEYDNQSDAGPALFGGEPVLHCVTTSDHSHSVAVSGPLGSDPLQNPKSAVVHARSFKQTTSNSFNPSSKLPLSPETSHPFELTPCEPLATTSTASVKHTEGLSDDILSRSIRKSLEAEAFSDCGDHPEHYVNASLSPLSESLTMTRAIGGTDSSDETIQLSLTFEDQLKQSHEETIVPFVSDHFKIPSSPPVEAIEYLQSGPYFKPATIFREHNARFSTEAVGAQHLPSSSPQSSPSMNSHYAPSSSPLPSSSPVEESSHISPPTSPQHPNEYDNRVGMSASSRQQEIYAEQNFSGYPTYSTEHMYYKPHYNYEQDDSFLSAGPSNLGASSYPPQISNHSMAPPLTHEHYDFTNRTNPYPIQATFETTETPISNTRHDSSGYEMHTYTIPVPHEISRQDGAYYEQRQTNDTGTNSPSPPLRRNTEPPKSNVVPRPKRSTPAGQRQQQKKLSKPFRSPVVHTPVRLAPKPATLHIPSPTVANSIVVDDQPSSFKAKNQEPNAVASSSSQTLDTKVKHRTQRAASQFKSPLPVTSTPLDEATLVRLTPTIQSLERKLQLLRRALKVREDVQEEVLEGLVKKWSEAGREAAWEVWDVVKDNTMSAETSSSNSSKGKKRSIDESWGWDESGDQKKPKVEKERNWGWDVEPVAEREGGDVLPGVQDAEITGTQEEEAGGDEEAPQPTLGTMLIQLGIAPETLGWDEEEDTFVDR